MKSYKGCEMSIRTMHLLEASGRLHLFIGAKHFKVDFNSLRLSKKPVKFYELMSNVYIEGLNQTM